MAAVLVAAIIAAVVAAVVVAVVAVNRYGKSPQRTWR